MLRYRVLTAAVGLPLLLYVTLMGGLPFLFVVLGLAVLAGFEFFRAVEGAGLAPYRGPGLLYVVFFVLFGYLQPGRFDYFPVFYALLFLPLLLILTREVFRAPGDTLKRTAGTLMGAVYTGGLFSFLLLLHAQFSAGAVLITYIASWSYDTAAYFVGLRWGKRRPLPEVSPKKSVEGAVGGAAGSLVALFVFALFSDLNLLAVPLLAVITGVFAPCGDLAASVFKREAEIKDYGTLLPGHGGVLDRFDSILFMAPIFFLVFSLMGWS